MSDNERIYDNERKPERRPVRVPTSRDALGNPGDYLECESEEAAAHWDARRWQRWSP